MVWDVCRGVLSDSHAAEDAFQATFLVLARRAGSIRRRDAVGPWLYGVARRVAVRAKTAAARRRLREGRAAEMKATPDPGPDPAGADRGAARGGGPAGGEIQAPLVLCYFEGRTHAEAARLLKCPVGTVSIRLSRARELLRARLTRRGLALPAAWRAHAPLGDRVGGHARRTGRGHDQGRDETRGRQGDDGRDGPGLDRPTRRRRNPDHDLHETDDDRGGRGGDRVVAAGIGLLAAGGRATPSAMGRSRRRRQE